MLLYVKNAVKCFTAVLLCLVIFAGCASVGSAGEEIYPYSLPAVELSSSPAEGEISAKSAIIIESESGCTLWEKNADEKLPMASTTKIMTALVALEACDVNKIVKVSPDAVGVEGSSVYLYAGEELSMSQLLYAMLLESANDAAAAIAIEVGGSIEGFARMMNDKARALGLVSTSFENPHGLDGDAHYTTARELAVIARAAMQSSEFRLIVSTYKTTIPLNGDEGARLLINHNKLLKSLEGATGVKTGFTKKSGRCLVSACMRDGVEYICVTLNAPSDWSDHKRLHDYASSLYEKRTLCEIGEIKYSLPVSGADVEFVTLSNREALSLILPKTDSEVKTRIELPRFLLGEAKAGEVTGYAVFYMDGREIARTPLCYETDVMQKQTKNKFFSWLFN